MSQKINIKELCKHIKHDGKHGTLLWIKQETQHFITNRHYLVRFDELPNQVLSALFSVYFDLPQAGGVLGVQGGTKIGLSAPPNIPKTYKPEEATLTGKTTDYLRQMDIGRFARVIKFPEYLTIVNEKYLQIAVDSEFVATYPGGNNHLPLYFAGGDLMVLPFRLTNEHQANGSDLLEAIARSGLFAEEAPA